MAAPSPPPASAPPPTAPMISPPVSTPPPRAGLGGAGKAVIAIVIVGVVVFAVLALGLIPGISLFGKNGPNGTTSADALGEASGIASDRDAGALVLAAGISTTFSYSFGYVPGNVSCPVSGGFTGDSENFTVPAKSGGYAAGAATLWVLLYYNSTAPSESVLAVVGSTAYFLGAISGAKCVGSVSFEPIPTTAASSATAASAVSAAASTFTSSHGSATALYAEVDDGTSGPLWYIAYTNCSYDPDTNTTSGGVDGDLFAGVVNGTTGVASYTDYETTLNCTAFSESNLSLAAGVPTAWVADTPGAPAQSLLGFAATYATSVAAGRPVAR